MWLKLRPTDSEVYFQWGSEEGPMEAYSVGVKTLATCGLAVRQALDQLVIAASIPQNDYSKELEALARAGSDLFYEMFPSAQQANAALAKRWLAEQRESNDLKLRITSHPTIHVPWGLVFEGNANRIPQGSTSLKDFAGFWGVKYNVACTLSGYNQPKARLARNREGVKLLNLVHREVAEQALNGLSDDSRALYEGLLHHPVGVAYDLKACEALIEKASPYDTIFHFFGHQADGCLELGDTPGVSVTEFKRLLEKLCDEDQRGTVYGLVLLNACGGAAGLTDYSFPQAATRPGMCGMVGTESLVPRDFAAEFSVRFLTLVLSCGESVGEALGRMRRDESFWPRSLSYGCYAQPDYRFRQSVALDA